MPVRIRTLRARALSVAILATLWGMLWGMGSAGAQYISPDLSPDGRLSVTGIPPQQEFEKRLEETRWNAGPVRLSPWLGLRDASLVTDTTVDDDGTETGDETELTATFGAGLRAYLGREVIWTAHLLPEYVWWQDLDDKGGLAGRAGTGVFGYLPRVRFEASWRRIDAQRYFTAELPVLTVLERQIARAAVEVEVSRNVFLYALGEREQEAGDAEDALVFTALDRSEEILSAGVGLRSDRGFEIALGIEETTVDFDDGARPLDNEGEAVRLFLGVDRERLKASVDLAFRDVVPVAASAFLPFDDTTGEIGVAWRAGRNAWLRGYALRRLGYGVSAEPSRLVSERVGVGLRLRPGGALFTLTAASGDDAYEELSGLRRLDDVTELRASLAIDLGDLLRLGLRWSNVDYESDIPDFDREVTAYGLTLELGALIDRLNLGSADGEW